MPLYASRHAEPHQMMNEAIKHHVIIAVDKAGCNTWVGNDTVRVKLNKTLFDYRNKSQEIERALYQAEDYISLLGFCIDVEQADMKTFALPLPIGGEPIVYNQLKYEAFAAKFKQWKDVSRNLGNENPFSLVSVAKPYALHALADSTKVVNRTFLILISDHHYNGNDFYDEVVSLTQMQQKHGMTDFVRMDKVFSLCYDVEQEYFIRHLATDTIFKNSIYPCGFIELYEYMPLQKNFTLSAAIDFPPVLKARRERGRQFVINLPLRSQRNPHYKVERLDVFPTYSAPRDTLSYSISEIISAENLGDYEMKINADRMASSIGLRAWVRLCDRVYNATILSPSREAPLFLGRNGLNYDIPIEYEEEATVWGLPFPDLFWIPGIESQHNAAMVFKLIVYALLLILLIVYIRRHRTYKPQSKDFSFGPM